MPQVPVQLVNSRDRAAVEVNGRVVVLHFRSWTQSAQVFVPVECMSVGRGQRRRFAYVGYAVLGPLLGFIAALLIASMVEAYCEAAEFAPAEVERYAWTAFAGVMLPAALLCLYGIVNYIRTFRTVYIDIDYEDGVERVEFWYKPGRDAALDAVVLRLEELHALGAEAERFPLKMGYTWNHQRPLRSVVAWAFAWMLPIYALMRVALWVAEWMAGAELHPPVWLIPAAFAAPWVWGFGLMALEQVRLLREPESFRRGLKRYNRADFGEAEADFEVTLTDDPHHLPSLYLLIDICLQRFDFTHALELCARLGDEDPELAESIQESIWALRRLSERMA
ncbi:MAG: hypothetical protein GC168_04720 [Candidatus Hydrogenedens sp.]|nr:hypothetical protein [Candidatus Hydrogenedens sp.]